MRQLVGGADGTSLIDEAESRWQLVEAAWDLNLPSQLLNVTYDASQKLLMTAGRSRTAVTGASGALNSYQKGACFYCYSPISTDGTSGNVAEVDHFFARSIGSEAGGAPIDGVWNLVLACHRCNGGHEKTNRPPHLRYVDRRHRRNEFLIASQHPLRPTLMAQTGMTPDDRAATLRQAYTDATHGGVRTPWEAPEELPPAF